MSHGVKKAPARRKAPRKAEADELAALLNEAARAPQSPPEVLVPETPHHWVEQKRAQIRKLAATPRAELLGRAEQTLVRQARRLLKANAEYGVSLSGVVRGGVMFLLSIPQKRKES